jgi:hypothetical protein
VDANYSSVGFYCGYYYTAELYSIKKSQTMTCTARESDPLVIPLEPPIDEPIEPIERPVIPDQVGDASLCGQPDTYQCPGGDCIRNDQRCNGRRWECRDNADEENCGIHTCFLATISVLNG